MSGLISQRTVRAGRAASFILPADADLDKFDPAAPRSAGLSVGERSTVAEQSTADGGDFLENSSDNKRNFLLPEDVGNSVLGALGGVVSVGDGKASCRISDDDSVVTGVVKLCQLRDLIARCRARCWRW